MKKLNKYQLGGLSSVVPQLISKRYPEAVRVGTTRPDEFEAMAAGEEGRYKVLDYLKSDRYKNILKRELAKSKSSDYPSGKKPTFDELYNERLNRVQNTPIEHLEKSPWAAPYNVVTGQGGQAIAYPGSDNKIIGKTYSNPLFTYDKMSLVNTPTKSKGNEHIEVGMEEAIHNSHVPLRFDSNTLMNVYNPRHKEKNAKKDTSEFNLTPHSLNVIKQSTIPTNKMHSFPMDYTSKDITNKSNYTLVPTEIITQIPKVLNDTNTKGRFTNKSFKHMVDNPTIAGERLLNATSGSFNPYNQLRDNKKLYRQTLKNTKRIMNNIADVGENDIPIARNGMKVPRIIKPSNITKPMGRPRTNYYRGNVMQDGGVAKGNAIELLKEKHALANERQMDQLNIPVTHRIDTTTPLTQQQKEEINRQVEARLYNIENGTQWLDSKIKSINKDINLANDTEYLKTANIPIMTTNPSPKYQIGGRLKMPILDTQIQNTTQPSFNYNGLKNDGFKLQSGGNVASNQREMAAGLNAGINQFNFPTKGLKKMTMTPESGNITDPVIMEGYTDGSLSDRKIAQPGQSNININADTIIEKPDLTYIDDFNEAYDHADKKKYPIFVWKGGEYPLKQHRKNK